MIPFYIWKVAKLTILIRKSAQQKMVGDRIGLVSVPVCTKWKGALNSTLTYCHHSAGVWGGWGYHKPPKRSWLWPKGHPFILLQFHMSNVLHSEEWWVAFTRQSCYVQHNTYVSIVNFKAGIRLSAGFNIAGSSHWDNLSFVFQCGRVLQKTEGCDA